MHRLDNFEKSTWLNSQRSLKPTQSFEDLMKSKDNQNEILEQIIDEVRCYEDVDWENFSEIFSLIWNAF